MTQAPEVLLDVRRLLLTHLDVDSDTSRAADLEPAEVGIVGDPDHRGGYHCGSDRVTSNDYSVVESPRDRGGLTLDAAGLDVGPFEVRVGGKAHNLESFSIWCVAQCKAGASDTQDIREIIYSPDGSTVKRWDRLGRRSSGDDSHLWHTHFSFHRDAIKAGRDQRPLFRRYLTYIGLLEDDEMDAAQFLEILQDPAVAREMRRLAVSYTGGGIPAGMNVLGVWADTHARAKVLSDAFAMESTSPDEIRALLAQLPAPASAQDIGEQVVAGLGGLDEADVARALVAAGQDPAVLAAELAKLASTTS